MGYQIDPESHGFILPFSSAVQFHGHICPGLAIGYYASHIGMRWLHTHISDNSEILVMVENAGCGVDAVQTVTGRTVGNGNLILCDYGKQVYTFLIKGTGRGLRVSLKSEFTVDRLDPGLASLQARVSGDEATPEEVVDLPHRIERICRAILETPGDVVFDIREVNEEHRGRGPRAGDVVCARCGEPVSTDRAKKEKDGYYCQPCQRNG
ncbi:FmdE family protein [Methanocella sp. MCL-LM]|uniref:FmdE family protein n=1 Tax=Methanocella sp. MCL-LM TaxID=3412035 RepID=UPI003C73C48B